MNSSRLLRPLAPFLLFALVACGGEPAPQPVADDETEAFEEAEAEVDAPAPAPAPAPEPDRAGALSPPPRDVPILIPADAIGGSPVTGIKEAWYRGKAALAKYCGDNGVSCDAFAVKETLEVGEHWQMRFFGALHGQGVYITVLVYPDGHAEVSR